MGKHDKEALRKQSERFETAPPKEILEWALAEFWPKLAISTAFGVEGCALIHLASSVRRDVPVFTVNTELLFAETLALMRRFEQELGIKLTRVLASMPLEEQGKVHGLRLYQRDPDLCCAIRKVEPTRRVVQGLDCWIAGLRRDQGPTRASISIVELLYHSDGAPLVRINPFANWSRNDTWKYVLENKVPYSPLLDQGYTSVGCWPCTKKVTSGQGERDGRWAESDKTECGIHTFMDENSPEKKD